MKLFRKHLSPEELGEMIYESLRAGMESSGDLSVRRFLEALDQEPDALDEQYVGEIIIALMFGATLAMERSASARVAEQLGAGMKSEFLNHLQEQGASAIQKAEWETVLSSRFLEYRHCIEDYSGFEPPWKLGRQLYWNVVGEQRYIAMSLKIATLYILAARDHAQILLNDHGPLLLTTRPKTRP